MSTHARVGVVQRNKTVLAFDVHLDGHPDPMVSYLLELATHEKRPVGLRQIDEVVRIGNMRALDKQLAMCQVAQDPAPSIFFPSEKEFKRVAIFNRHQDQTVSYFYIVHLNGEVSYRDRCDNDLNYWCRLKKGFIKVSQITNNGTNTIQLPAILEYGAGWKVWVHK